MLLEVNNKPRTARETVSAEPPSSVGRGALSVTEATAYRGGISRAMFYELVRRDEIRTLKIGSRRLVRLVDIDEFLAQQVRQ